MIVNNIITFNLHNIIHFSVENVIQCVRRSVLSDTTTRVGLTPCFLRLNLPISLFNIISERKCDINSLFHYSTGN